MISLLKDGLEKVTAAFPWIAGQVVNDDRGVFIIKPFEETPRLIIKDLRDKLPAMDRLREARFPFSMLDENIIAPCKTLPERFEKPAPVFLLQANFITRGLLLVFSGQHNCMVSSNSQNALWVLQMAVGVEILISPDLLLIISHISKSITLIQGLSSQDIAGQSHIIDLFSKACRGKPFSIEEEKNGNLIQEHIYSLWMSMSQVQKLWNEIHHLFQ